MAHRLAGDIFSSTRSFPRDRTVVRIRGGRFARSLFCVWRRRSRECRFLWQARRDNGRFLWKSVARAQCKLDDKTPLTWNVYQTEKKKEANLVLVLLGRRYLALDIKGKVAYYVFPSDLQAKGQDFESGYLFVQVARAADDGWTVRDVGPAELIKLTLGDYGRRARRGTAAHAGFARVLLIRAGWFFVSRTSAASRCEFPPS